MMTPSWITRPLIDWIVPRFLEGQVHNVLSVAGLRGLVSLIGIPVLWALAAVVTMGAAPFCRFRSVLCRPCTDDRPTSEAY
jgi:hypothetical protein